MDVCSSGPPNHVVSLVVSLQNHQERGSTPPPKQKEKHRSIPRSRLQRKRPSEAFLGGEGRGGTTGMASSASVTHPCGGGGALVVFHAGVGFPSKPKEGPQKRHTQLTLHARFGNVTAAARLCTDCGPDFCKPSAKQAAGKRCDCRS